MWKNRSKKCGKIDLKNVLKKSFYFCDLYKIIDQTLKYFSKP